MWGKFKARHGLKHRQTLSLALAAAVLCTVLPGHVFALEASAPSEYLCGHVHDGECGYAEGREETPCTHTHDEKCGYAPESPCTHVHDGTCGYQAAVTAAPCTHVCSILSFDKNTAGTALSSYEAAAGAALADISAALPKTLKATISCKAETVDVHVTWECAGYSGEAGTYTFKAKLSNPNCAYAALDDVKTEDIDESALPFISVTVPEATTAPETTSTPALPTTLTEGAVSVTGVLPEGAYLLVTELATADAQELLGDADAKVLFAYDIKIMLPGALDEATGERGEPSEYQPTAEKPVTVTVKSTQPIDASEVEVTHIAEDEATGEKTPQSVATVTPTENTVEFQTESFSVYIGTTDKPAESCPPEIYWNGTNFFADEACTETKKLFHDAGEAYSNLPLLLDDIEGDTTIYMKAEYLVGSVLQTIGSSHTVTLKRHSSYSGALITVSSGATLTLNSITIDGGSADATPISATDAAISVQGSLTMNRGAVVRNNAYNGDSYVGGGVNMLSGSGVFTMTGGTISGNSSVKNGGGVYIDKDATFNMSGGTISDNTATKGAGVYNKGTMEVSGSPDIADEVYLADSTIINVTSDFAPAAPLTVNGDNWAEGRIIAQYDYGMYPKASLFATTGVAAGVDGQDVVLPSSPTAPVQLSVTVPLTVAFMVNDDKTLSCTTSSYGITNNGDGCIHVEEVKVVQGGVEKPVLVTDMPDAPGELSLTMTAGSVGKQDSIALEASEGASIDHVVCQSIFRPYRWNIEAGSTLPISFSNGRVYGVDASWGNSATSLFRITYTVAAGKVLPPK